MPPIRLHVPGTIYRDDNMPPILGTIPGEPLHARQHTFQVRLLVSEQFRRVPVGDSAVTASYEERRDLDVQEWYSTARGRYYGFAVVPRVADALTLAEFVWDGNTARLRDRIAHEFLLTVGQATNPHADITGIWNYVENWQEARDEVIRRLEATLLDPERARILAESGFPRESNIMTDIPPVPAKPSRTLLPTAEDILRAIKRNIDV